MSAPHAPNPGAIAPDAAAAALDDVAGVQQRTREALFYAGSASILILWGVLTSFGYAFNILAPQWARIAWLVIQVVGVAGTFLIILLRRRGQPAGTRDFRLIYALVMLLGFGFLWLYVLGSFTLHQQAAFVPSLVMFGFMAAGLWLGRKLLLAGAFGMALIVAGYFWAGPWFPLWMAAVQAITLIAGGLWLRRVGAPQ